MVDGPRQVAVSGVDPAGNVRLYADEGQKMSLSPANGGQSSVRDGVATTTSPGGETTSVSLLSEDMSAQVVTILKTSPHPTLTLILICLKDTQYLRAITEL